MQHLASLIQNDGRDLKIDQIVGYWTPQTTFGWIWLFENSRESLTIGWKWEPYFWLVSKVAWDTWCWCYDTGAPVPLHPWLPEYKGLCCSRPLWEPLLPSLCSSFAPSSSLHFPKSSLLLPSLCQADQTSWWPSSLLPSSLPSLSSHLAIVQMKLY